tara:strand:+ start:85 stop:318 length:234 start_codon:yes stop_codon:yes gene_type:complete
MLDVLVIDATASRYTSADAEVVEAGDRDAETSISVSTLTAGIAADAEIVDTASLIRFAEDVTDADASITITADAAFL